MPPCTTTIPGVISAVGIITVPHFRHVLIHPISLLLSEPSFTYGIF
jgi:hypothetical protein